MRGITAEFKVAEMMNVGTPDGEEDIAFVKLAMDVVRTGIPSKITISNTTEYDCSGKIGVNKLQRASLLVEAVPPGGGQVSKTTLDLTMPQLELLRTMVDKAIQLFAIERRALTPRE